MYKIINTNLTKRFHIISFIIGILISVACIGTYIYYYHDKSNSNLYTILSVCVILLVFSIELIVINLNFDNIIIRYIIILLLGLLIGISIYNKMLQTGMILLLICMGVFLLSMIFKNIFSTVITMSMFSILFMVPITVLVNRYERNSNAIIYIGITLFIMCYKVLGLKLNKLFIARGLGFQLDADKYNESQLKNQLLLFYFVIFITLNLTNSFTGTNANFGNLINNSFLTGMAVIQIDWKELLLFYRK